MHYTREKFPEDLKFQQTSDRTNFHGRYILHHPYTGNLSCDGGEEYQKLLQWRQEEEEIANLAQLTGWDVQEISARVNAIEPEPYSGGKIFGSELPGTQTIADCTGC